MFEARVITNFGSGVVVVHVVDAVVVVAAMDHKSTAHSVAVYVYSFDFTNLFMFMPPSFPDQVLFLVRPDTGSLMLIIKPS